MTSSTVASRRERIQRSRSVRPPSAPSGRVAVHERVDVPQLAQEQPHALADLVGVEQVGVPRLLGGEEVPAQRVGAVAVEDLPRVDDVAQRLGHLAALAVEDQPEAQHALVRRPAEQQRRDGEQRVEPAARLIERLADVVGREALLEALLVLERRVLLGERHRAGVKPHVDDLGHARHRLARTAGTGSRSSSTNGRCGSSTSVPLSCSSSANDPITWMWPWPQRHTGSGVPQ